MLGRPPHVLDHPAHRRANDDEVGLGDPFGHVDRRIGHGADASGDSQADLTAADANDLLGKPQLADRQPDRPPYQPDPHNGHSFKPFHDVTNRCARLMKRLILADVAWLRAGARMGGKVAGG